MGQDTSQIMNHIENEREKLGQNLEEFESRIKDATNPRNWFDKSPALFLGAAAAGGVLLGLLVTSARDDEWETVEPRPQPMGNRPRHTPHLNAIRETLDTTLGALVGLGSRKFQDFVSQALPGFQEQYDETRRRQTAWQAEDPEAQHLH